MREIKFRVWDIGNKFMKYIDGFYWFEENHLDRWNDWKFGVEYILMQFTGLHDKNGKEIWEGDILSGGVNGSPRNVVVEWSHEKYWCGMTDGYTAHCVGFNIDEYYIILENCEVIGNIYEHRYLLEDK